MISGGRYTLSSGRDVVSLTLDSSDRTDAGNWTCTAQVYESGTGSLPVGGPVEISVQLVVVGEFQSALLKVWTSQLPCPLTVAPSAPESVEVDSIGPTWVSFSWFQLTRGIPTLSRHVILVVGGGEERNVTVESSEMAANVTDLLSGTEYMFRVVAVSEFRDVQAPSPPSNTLNVTTATSGEKYLYPMHGYL